MNACDRMDLPADILLTIFDHLLPPKTRRERAWLHSLLHVSRSFRGYLEPRLYRTLAEHDLYFPDERERRRELYDRIVTVNRKDVFDGHKIPDAEVARMWDTYERVILRKHSIPLLFRTLICRADLAKRVKKIFLQDLLEDGVDHWHESGWIEIVTYADLPECLTPEESKKVQEFVQRRFKKYGKRVEPYRQRWVEASGRWSVNVCAALILCLTDNLEHLMLQLHYKEFQKGITLARLRCLRILNLETRFYRDWFLGGEVVRLVGYSRCALDERSPYALYYAGGDVVMDDAYPIGDIEFEIFQRHNKDRKEAAKTVSEEAHRRVAARNPTSADILQHLSSYSSQGLIEFSFEGRWHPSRNHVDKLSLRQLLLRHKGTLERLQVIVQPYTFALWRAGVGLGSLEEFTKLKHLSTQLEALLGDGPLSRRAQLKDILPPSIETLDFSSSNGYYSRHPEEFLHATNFDDGDTESNRVRMARDADLKAFQDLEGAIKDEPGRFMHLKQVRMRVGLVNWYMGLPKETALPCRMPFAADSSREYIFFSDKLTVVSFPENDA